MFHRTSRMKNRPQGGKVSEKLRVHRRRAPPRENYLGLARRVWVRKPRTRGERRCDQFQQRREFTLLVVAKNDGECILVEEVNGLGFHGRQRARTNKCDL